MSIGRAQGTEVQRSKERVLAKVPAKKTNIINIKKRGQSKTKDSSGADVKATNQKSKTNQSKTSLNIITLHMKELIKLDS